MTAETQALMMLSVTMTVHLVGTIWWAARLTTRVEHIERWIMQNEETAARIAGLSADVKDLKQGVNMIRDHLLHWAHSVEGQS